MITTVPETITDLEEAAVEIARLREVIAQVGNLTRYTLNPRWALATITKILAKATVTAEEGK